MNVPKGKGDTTHNSGSGGGDGDVLGSSIVIVPSNLGEFVLVPQTSLRSSTSDITFLTESQCQQQQQQAPPNTHNYTATPPTTAMPKSACSTTCTPADMCPHQIGGGGAPLTAARPLLLLAQRQPSLSPSMPPPPPQPQPRACWTNGVSVMESTFTPSMASSSVAAARVGPKPNANATASVNPNGGGGGGPRYNFQPSADRDDGSANHHTNKGVEPGEHTAVVGVDFDRVKIIESYCPTGNSASLCVAVSHKTQPQPQAQPQQRQQQQPLPQQQHSHLQSHIHQQAAEQTLPAPPQVVKSDGVANTCVSKSIPLSPSPTTSISSDKLNTSPTSPVNAPTAETLSQPGTPSKTLHPLSTLPGITEQELERLKASGICSGIVYWVQFLL
ncbi:hypothetical protein Pelo_8062 [Pelomyxa schiedti]|nr:hypothetical protein Pelo_8062 [Pelomyxa schiedti]